MTLIETDANSILHYDFNQGYGSMVEDLSVSGNDGTIYGDTQWSDDVPEVSNSGGSVASTSYTPSEALEDNNLYYWNVSVTDQLGLSYTTPTQTFVVNTQDDLPSDFALLSPENESMVANLSPSFFWDESFDIDYLGSVIGYDFYIGTSNDLSDVTPIQVNTNSYTLQSQLEEDQIYYWKVAAISDNGLETLSECWSFYTNSENSVPSEFTLLSPEHQSEVTTLQPLLNWSESNDPDLYDNLSYTVLYGLDPNNLVENESGNLSGSLPVVFEPSENDVLVETLDLAFTSFQQLESVPLNAGTNYYLKFLALIVFQMVMQAMLLITMMPHGVRMKPVQYLPCHGHGMAKVGNYQLLLIITRTIYFYFFEGDGTSEIFSFEDGGGYGDNGGALNIEIYEMVNQFESNYSLSFDGIDDWVDTGIPHTDLSGASSLTFEFSFKRISGSSDGQYQGLITSQTSGESQLGIRITDLNYLELGFKNDNSSYSDAIYDAETIDFDVWYNFYVELSNNQVVWYRDGVQVETDNVDFQSLGQESENVPPLSIGRGNTVYGEYFDGLVNEVVITIGNQNNDFAYWDFNDAEGNILTDLSGNGNNGTIYGAEWSDDVPNIGNSSSQC